MAGPAPPVPPALQTHLVELGNLVERLFRELTDTNIRRGSFPTFPT